MAWSQRGLWRLGAANRDPLPGRPIGSLQEATHRSVIGAVETGKAAGRVARLPIECRVVVGRTGTPPPAKLHAAIAAITPAEADATGATAPAGLDTPGAPVG